MADAYDDEANQGPPESPSSLAGINEDEEEAVDEDEAEPGEEGEEVPSVARWVSPDVPRPTTESLPESQRCFWRG